MEKDTIWFALTLTAMGMGAVFLVLSLLAVIIHCLNVLFDRGAKKKQTLKEEIAIPLVGGFEMEIACSDARNGGRIPKTKVAAVAAAIAFSLGGEGRPYQVTSIQQVASSVSTGASAWVQHGRQRLINSRLNCFSRKERS